MKILLLLTTLSFYTLNFSQSTMNYQKYIVHFDFGESELSSSEIKKWEEFKSNLPSDFSIIELKAHTDTVSSAKFNLHLAAKRLASAKALLQLTKPTKETVIGEADANKSSNYKDTEFRIVEINYLLTPKIIDEPTDVTIPKTQLSQTIEQLVKDKDLKSIQYDLSILFEPGLPIILPSSLPELNDLNKIMHENKNLNIIIHGHVCCSSEPSLAINRAGAVYNFLKNNNVKTERMSIKGHDNKDPKVWPERTEEDRIANRRVSIEFIKQ